MNDVTDANMVTFLKAIEDRPKQDVLSHELDFSKRLMYEVFKKAQNKKYIKGGSNTETLSGRNTLYRTYTSDVTIEPRGKVYLSNHS